MRAELAVGALVLHSVGVLTSVAPARIGDNEFAVDLDDRRPGAGEVPATVLLDFGMQGMDMGELRLEALPTGTQRYTARGSYVAMGGRWQVGVVVRRPGFDDVRHTFEMDILRR